MSAEEASKKRSWTAYIPRPGSSGGRPSSNSAIGGSVRRPGSSSGFKIKEVIVPLLAPPQEGKELSVVSPPLTPLPAPIPISTFVTLPTPSPSSSGTTSPLPPPFPRAATLESPPVSRPTTPKRWNSLILTAASCSTKPSKTPQELDQEASNLILTALERTNSNQQTTTSRSPDNNSRGAGSFGKMSFSSMMGGLSSLSLSRTSTRDSTNDDKDRGRSMLKMKRVKSASQAPPETEESRSRSRARSQSPFAFRRFRTREHSPTPQPLPLGQSDADLSDTASSIRPRSTAFMDDDSGDETVGETTDADEEFDDTSDEDVFDPVTERNTERNAIITVEPEASLTGLLDGEEPDPLGEGVNVVVPPEPYFPSSLNSLGSSTVRGKRNPKRRKSVKHHEPLPLNTSRPVFQRDRCTITLTQGDPATKLGERRKRRYVVASDLSEESRYAVEWGIGTVLRDGDEMLVVTVSENEAKIDPPIPNAADRQQKLRSQQERQGLAYILVRQVTSLLQRTKLNVTVSCQAWHAKNSRHMLLDIVDYTEPTMLIVGSRGLGQLNGILLGSTSHYLIQKCSVPVMVARRRLKRPPKRSAHLSTHRVHVSLAEAGIDRVAPKVDQDVKVMRDEIEKDDIRRDGGPGSRDDRRGIVETAEPDEEGAEGDDDVAEDGDDDDEPAGIKVAG
ncbi:hypothetical protein BDQ12DRAFT_721229 [Crucibulum laeve]|uniref:UspA domain-containing protein n=1 Tax=Crucibulum laeve TaxID=68775 RepID=A0A5C3M7E6_9AGAR|nr:hypothetical protein BDQ12DRAFT_721229 [Crucibulum laeve]